MKTNFLKKMLPIGVGMMAVAFAFATEAQSSKEDAFVPGYIYDIPSNTCKTANQDCNNVGNTPCTYMNVVGAPQVFGVNNGTSCSVPLTHQKL